jgi:hypothetical protein
MNTTQSVPYAAHIVHFHRTFRAAIELPIMNCADCTHLVDMPHDGGWCYMFKTQPLGSRCGQMRLTAQARREIADAADMTDDRGELRADLRQQLQAEEDAAAQAEQFEASAARLGERMHETVHMVAKEGAGNELL